MPRLILLFSSFSPAISKILTFTISIFIENVKVITVDGRLFLGMLEGFDNNTNIVISSAKERVFFKDRPTEDMEMGLCIVRGNEVVAICDYDEEEEAVTDYTNIHAEKLKDTKNSLM